MPDYKLDFFSKGTNFPGEAILFAVGEEEDETPHDWQMFFDGAVNQNGNGVGSSPFLHACYLKARQKEPSPYSHSCQVEILLHKQTISQNILRVSQALRALELRIKEIDVYGDSSLIIFQTTGDWKTKDQKLIPYHQYLEDISLKFRRITFNYLSRTKNQFADALATLASMISRRY